MRVYYQNVHGLRTKLTDLLCNVSLNNYHVIMLTETNLSDDVTDEELGLTGYSVSRADRSGETNSKKSMGGVLIAIDITISCRRISTTAPIEQVYVAVGTSQIRFVLGCIYLPPNSSAEKYVLVGDTIDIIICDAFPGAVPCVAGDFNLPRAAWIDEDLCSLTFQRDDVYVPPQTTEAITAMSDICAFHNFFQLKHVYNINNVIFDLVLSHCKFNVTPSDPLFRVDEHHPPFCFDIDASGNVFVTSQQANTFYYDFKSADYTVINDYLGTICWDDILSDMYVEDMVSFFSTSPELSNKQRFEYFSRTIPSDHHQVKAMVDIVMLMGWSYISIIYEESNYGIKAFEVLEDLLVKNKICIAVKEKLVKDSGVGNISVYDNIVQKLQTKPRARGCIIFGSDQEVAELMKAVRRCNATGSFSWIGSDGWSARSLVSDGNEAEVEGTLSVQPQANPVRGFKEYFLSLNVENNPRNPWFIEFWEHHFSCRYPNSSKTPYNVRYTKNCTGKEQLTEENTVFEDQLQFVSDAVMAFAYAIRDLHADFCKKPGLCDAMKPTKGSDLLKYLHKVSFTGLSGDRFHFDENGDGPARYNIIHFKQVLPGKYQWVRVGEYLEGSLELNMSEIQFKLGQPKPPESVCSLPCAVGQAKKYVEKESCCWHCFNCTQYQIRSPFDPTQCIACPMGELPDFQHVRCIPIPEEHLQPDSGWAIGAMAFSSTGMLITLFVFGVFIKHNATPVVRAAGRELSYTLLAGILMCYSVTYALVLKPTDIVCGIQRFGAGFCFTVVYAALLTKTNRISRIFKAGKHSAKRPNFISPRSQLIICTGLVGVQVLINGVWMIISPPRAIHHYPTREDNLLVCSSYIDASYMIAFTYPIFLIVVCTIYAVLTRKIPEAFNESKHIGFTMYTTCVIWLAFVPLYFGTANHVALRITSMSVTISLSATVTLTCLFSPKLYIILIRPERNVRQSMMPMRYSAINKSSVTAGSGSMMAAVVVTAATCDQNQKIQKAVSPVDNTPLEIEKVKIQTKDTSTQTSPTTSTNNLNGCSLDNLGKINNNCNGPVPVVPAQIKDLTL